VILLAGGGWYWYEYIWTTDDQVVVTDSGQQGGTTTTTSTTDEGSTQAQVTDQTGTSAATGGGATDAASTNASGSSTDATTVAANGDQTGTGGTTTDQSVPIVDASTDAGTTTSTSGASSAATDGGQSTGTDVALLPQTLDVAKLRDDANRAVQGLSCADVRIDASASGDITASGFAGSEADREQVTRLLQGVPKVGRIDNAVAVMPWPLCGAMDAVREQAAFNLGLPQTPGIDPGGANGVYLAGDHLLIGVTAPDFDGYLYLDYYDAAEKYVVHLLPNEMRPDNRVRAGQQIVVGTLPQEKKSYEVRPPFGSNLLVAIASPEPLFDRPRPLVEQPADEYVAALRSSLERARQGGAGNLSASSADLVFKQPD
jgi:hypothetical protein